MSTIDMIIDAARTVIDSAQIDADSSGDHAQQVAAYAVVQAFNGFIDQLEYLRLVAVEDSSK